MFDAFIGHPSKTSFARSAGVEYNIFEVPRETLVSPRGRRNNHTRYPTVPVSYTWKYDDLSARRVLPEADSTE